LGTWLRRTAPPGLEVVSVVHRAPVDAHRVRALDLRDPEAVDVAMGELAPDLVIHAAYAPGEQSIVGATANVAAAAARIGAGLVFISTDAVFAGDGVARAEEANPDPEADYGRHKATAEAAVREASSAFSVVRLPLVVSLDPPDAAVARIRAAAARGEIARWFDDEIRQPAEASELARAIWAIAELTPPEAAGAWHLPGSERISRYEIARRVAAAANLPASCVEGEPTPEGVVRPRDLHLRAGRARVALGWAPTPVLGGSVRS
jgi:dTDP-4-dehydrorhamnose reductase